MDAVVKQDAAVHGVIFLGAVGGVAIVLPHAAWPWHLLLPLVAYTAIVLTWPRLRRGVPRPAIGRLVGWPLAAAAALAVVMHRVNGLSHAGAAGRQRSCGANPCDYVWKSAPCRCLFQRGERGTRGTGFPLCAVGGRGVRVEYWRCSRRDVCSIWPGTLARLSAWPVWCGVGGSFRSGAGAAPVVDRRIGVSNRSSRLCRRDDFRFTVVVGSFWSSSRVKPCRLEKGTGDEARGRSAGQSQTGSPNSAPDRPAADCKKGSCHSSCHLFLSSKAARPTPTHSTSKPARSYRSPVRLLACFFTTAIAPPPPRPRRDANRPKASG